MRTPPGGTGAGRRLGPGAAAAAPVALTVVLAVRGDVGEKSLWVSAISAFVSVCALAGDLSRGPAADPVSGPEHRRRVADELAEAVRTQWDAENRLRRLQDPAPLGVRWTHEGPPLADHAANVRRGRGMPGPRGEGFRGGAGPGGEGGGSRLVRLFRVLPARRLVVLGAPGAGKTVLAVRFVLEALDARPEGGPVPVLLTLAS
jgi:hypothetical protein